MPRHRAAEPATTTAGGALAAADDVAEQPAMPDPTPQMRLRRIAFVVEYDGTDFHGSQYQSNARTVQGDLEAAARRALKIGSQRIRLAGRTDAGVHASHQVAAVDIASDLCMARVRDAMNGNLAADVAVVRAVDVGDPSFDPRRHAVRRTYRYVLNCTGVRSPLRDRFEAARRGLTAAPDVDVMCRCAQKLVGTHDVRAFARVVEPTAMTVRTIEAFSVAARADGRVVFVVSGRSFLQQQVRRMVGLLVEIGLGDADAGAVQHHLEQPEPGAVQLAMPARGLTLVGIDYPTHLRGISASDRADTACADASTAWRG